MTPKMLVVPRIPFGVTMLLVFVGFVLVYTGATALQALGGIALMSAIAIPILGPGKRIDTHRATEPSRTNADAKSDDNVDRNGHPRVSNGGGPNLAGTRRAAEDSRRRARKKREESAASPGR